MTIPHDWWGGGIPERESHSTAHTVENGLRTVSLAPWELELLAKVLDRAQNAEIMVWALIPDHYNYKRRILKDIRDARALLGIDPPEGYPE